jgi:DNA-binding NarL/FixJ family response regulator
MIRTTILLAEDHKIVRAGFRRLLELEDDFEVVGEVEDGRQAVAFVKENRPTVVLMDIAMPRLNGLEATRQLLKAIPATKVLMLSAQNDATYVKEAADTGVKGFVPKLVSPPVLYEAIREIQNGNTYFYPKIAKRHHERDHKPAVHSGLPRPRKDGLTSRELEVLQLVAEGNPNKVTAAELGICSKTVEKHRENLTKKLGIHDTAGLTRYAIAAGIIESSVQLIIG